MKRERGDGAEQARVDQHLAQNRDDGMDLFHQVSVRAHQRTIPGPPTPNGEERKETALATLEAGNAEVIAWLRTQLHALYHDREQLRGLLAESGAWVSGMSHKIAYVTGDDVYRLLHNNPTWSYKLEGRQAWRSSVWRKGFQKIPGLHVPSLRPDQHAALLQAWRPQD